MGLTYAVSWNGRYYTDYSQAYRDVMDSDPTTDSYINFSSITVGMIKNGSNRIPSG